LTRTGRCDKSREKWKNDIAKHIKAWIDFVKSKRILEGIKIKISSLVKNLPGRKTMLEDIKNACAPTWSI
jgi:hypothetical protein